MNLKDKPYIYKIVLQVTILLIFLLYILFYITSAYTDFRDNKNTLRDVVSENNQVSDSGLEYQDFKDIYTGNKSDNDYINKVILQIKKDFYDDTFAQNIESDNFLEKLELIKTELERKENSTEILNRGKDINKLIPYYVDGVDTLEGNITDLEFINYIEKVIYSFNLKSSDNITISQIFPVENNDTKNKQQASQNLESDLFYTPISMKVEGRKQDLIDFLYFAENVGSISVDDDSLLIKEDKNFRKILAGDNFSSDYNIFKNQLFTIEKLGINDYLDSSSNIRQTNDFIEYVSNTQGREKVVATMTLNFYFKGVPLYRIDSQINFVMTEYTELVKTVAKTLNIANTRAFLKNGSEAVSILNNLRNYDMYLKEQSDYFSKEIKRLRKDKDNIYDIYKDILVYNKRFEEISSNLENIQDEINNLKQ